MSFFEHISGILNCINCAYCRVILLNWIVRQNNFWSIFSFKGLFLNNLFKLLLTFVHPVKTLLYLLCSFLHYMVVFKVCSRVVLFVLSYKKCRKWYCVFELNLNLWLETWLFLVFLYWIWFWDIFIAFLQRSIYVVWILSWI